MISVSENALVEFSQNKNCHDICIYVLTIYSNQNIYIYIYIYMYILVRTNAIKYINIFLIEI